MFSVWERGYRETGKKASNRRSIVLKETIMVHVRNRSNKPTQISYREHCQIASYARKCNVESRQNRPYVQVCWYSLCHLLCETLRLGGRRE